MGFAIPRVARRGTEAAPLFDLSGMVAIVTGGGRGIGRGAARALARQGASVVVNYVGNEEAARETAREVEGFGVGSETVRANVADEAGAEEIVERAKETFGRVDILVNNAGIISFAPFMSLTSAEWDRVVDVDLKGTFLVSQAAARAMVEEGHGGRIINIASIGSGGVGVGFPGIAHYSAAKGGVIALTETMAIELAPRGILVNAIAPGFIETDMTKPTLGSEEALRKTLGRIPLGRAGRPEEIGAAVAFLASREASYMTGSTLYVDGGWLAE